MKNKTLFSALLAGLLCLALLAGCGGTPSSAAPSVPGSSSTPASVSTPASSSVASVSANPFAEIDEAAYIAAAEKALDLFHAADFEELTAMFRSDLAAELTDALWQSQADTIYGQVGAYKSRGETQLQTATDPTLGDVVAVLVACEYEKYTVTWQAVFNLDMELVTLVTVGAS